MSRLIDADVMHREIDKHDPEGRLSLKNIKIYIDVQPTAYNIDNVVKQLEDHAIEFEAFGICSDYVELTHAIAIVKGGAE